LSSASVAVSDGPAAKSATATPADNRGRADLLRTKRAIIF